MGPGALHALIHPKRDDFAQNLRAARVRAQELLPRPRRFAGGDGVSLARSIRKMKGRAIAIGASADGIAAISRIVAGLPRDFAAPVFVAQHVGRASSGALPHILSRASALPAIHPREGQLVEPGMIYVAPPDHHLLVRGDTLHLSRGPEENWCRPSIDALFRSVALAYGAAAVGIVLTGYLDDGTVGLLAIKDRGGVAIVQDPAEAGAPDMVRHALARVPIDHVCRVNDIPSLLLELVADDPGETRPDSMLEIEDRIATGDVTGCDQLALAMRLSVECPLCAGSLYVMKEPRLWRFRCAKGHAFTEDSWGADGVAKAG